MKLRDRTSAPFVSTLTLFVRQECSFMRFIFP
jgi:hypothetical protein